jgi:Raf kinase inhibitor-like YbhB/YbcL family protein
MTWNRGFALSTAVAGLGLLTTSCAHSVLASQPTLHVVSGAIQQDGTIPTQFTCDGANVSPALKWSNPPVSTRSVAVIVDDPDAPNGTFTHWIVYNIPPTIHRLPENVLPLATLPSGSKQGQNDFEHTGYGGPCPPPGSPHHYHFHVYALDTTLQLPDNPIRGDIDSNMQGHIIAQGELVATYGRAGN